MINRFVGALRIATFVLVAIATLGTAGKSQVTFTEFPIPTAGTTPYVITAGPDGNVWFTDSNGNHIGRVTPAGVITEFSVPTSSSLPVGICMGPDGNLWFTEAHGHKIGRITPAGVITE